MLHLSKAASYSLLRWTRSPYGYNSYLIFDQTNGSKMATSMKGKQNYINPQKIILQKHEGSWEFKQPHQYISKQQQANINRKIAPQTESLANSTA
jgi:hypothetical protein